MLKSRSANVMELRRIKALPMAAVVASLGFLVLYWEPLRTLLRDWWSDPDAGHGLLLGPLAVWLAWKQPRATRRAPQGPGQPVWGLIVLSGAIVLRYLAGLAAELFTMRMSLLGALFGIVVFLWGWQQLRRWWLPAALLILSVPIPDIALSHLAFPLQLKAAESGAALLEMRHVPVRLAGNVIQIPGHSLFVTEACSGLRSLTALIAVSTLVGGLWLTRPWTRVLLVLSAIPVAIALNGCRIFLTGFLVYYVSPALGEGLMHYSEGWAMSIVAFGILGAFAWGLARIERRSLRAAVP